MKKGKPQPCYLRLGDDALEDASFCSTIAEAKDQYGRAARQLAGFGQQVSGTLHFVDAQGDEIAEYPDRVLRLSKYDNVIMSNC